MSYAHQGSRLMLSGNPFVLGYTSAYFDFNNDTSGVQYGDLIEPVGSPIYTMRPYEGRFGGGVAIEQYTSNLMTNPMFDSNVSGWGNGNNVSVSWNSGSNDIKNGNGFLYVSAISGGNGFATGPNIGGLSSGGTYTVSAYAEGDYMDISGSVTIGGTVFYSGGSYDDYTWSPSTHSYTKINNRGIYRIEKTFTLNQGSNSGNAFSYFNPRIGLNGNNLKVKIYGYQVENLPFGTSMVSGSRASGGALNYPTIINPLKGTISFWYKPEYDQSVVTSQSNSPILVQIGDYYGNSSITIWNYIGKYTLYVKGATSSGWSVTDLTDGSVFTKGVWTMLSITWNGTSWKMYRDGILVISSTANENLGSISSKDVWIGSSSNNQTPANGIFSDVIIDNYDYSADDIESMYLSSRPLFNPFDKRTYAL